MRLSQNLLIGVINSIWSAVVSLAVVPLYLHYLGIESYGLIGFFATTQAVLQLLDLGLAPTITREVARCMVTGNLKTARNLLHTLAVIYWGMAGAIALTIALLASPIAEHWLKSTHLPQETVGHAVALMGLVIACRWPIALYQGVLIGGQRLIVASGINITMVTVGNFGAVAILAFISPTVHAFFIWQAGVGLAYAMTVRWAAWHMIKKSSEVWFDGKELMRIWRFSMNMGGVSVLAALLMQLDKLLLSKMLNLEDFGRYMLAALLANTLLVLLTPVFNVIYPRLSSLVAVEDTEELIKLYRLGTRLLSAALFPIALSVATSSQDLIFVWTGNLELAERLAPIVTLLLVGTAINGVMIFPYALQLAYGATRLALTIVAALIIVFVPLIILLVQSYGVVGGALAWASLNCVYLVLGAWMTHRYLLKGLALSWLFRDVGIPLCSALLIVLPVWRLAHMTGAHYLNLILAGGLALLAFFVISFSQGLPFTNLWHRYYRGE